MMQTSALEKTRGLVKEATRQGKVTATAERLAKLDVDGIEELPAEPGYRAGQRVLAGPLEQAYRKGEISTREWEAGERCRNDAYLANVDVVISSVDWGGVGGTAPGSRRPAMLSSERAYEATRRWRDLEAHFRKGSLIRNMIEVSLVREQNFVVIGENFFAATNERDARNAGKAGFRVMLAALADFYGK